MKKLVVIGAVLVGITLVLTTSALESLMMFIIAGHIPFTNSSVPALLMLMMWIVIIPASIIVYKLGISSTWRLIEKIGVISQRRINRQIRWLAQTESLQPLYAVVLLKVASGLPADESSTSTKAPLRRRFSAIPA